MKTQLSNHHYKTYQHLFQHPLPHNLQWRDVSSMLSALPDATVIEDDKGNLKITRAGQTLNIHRPHGKDFADHKELMDVRRFLDETAPAIPPAPGDGSRLLVVIDHRQARIFTTELKGTAPHRVHPYDPHGVGRALHYNHDEGSGQRKPELKSFYQAVAKTLAGAKQILLFGAGTGSSSAMEHLHADLKQNHPDIAKHVIGAYSVDEHHLTEDQLLAKARDLFATT
jgi:hypothetical protein